MKTLTFLFATATLALAGITLFARQDGADTAGMPQLAKPGPQHEILARQVGTWNAVMSMEGMPDSKAVYTAALDHGGLWLVADYRGEFMGGPFSGHEVKGYDSAKKRYVSTWVDSMTDGMKLFEGDYDAKTRTLSMWIDGHDRTGKPVRERHDTTFVEPDNFVFAINFPDESGAYVPVMTITYQRKK